MSCIGMNEFSMWLTWLSHWFAWIIAVWFALALLIGIPWIISDEIHIKRTAPKPSEVGAYADKMEAEHGAEAQTVIGEAMHDPRGRGDFVSRRFLKEVSGELVRRMLERE
jgi:hypothetical protein